LARAAARIGRFSQPKTAIAAAESRDRRQANEGGDVRFAQLRDAISEYLEEASRYLQREVEGGAEVPLELERRTAGLSGPPLYCYRPLTGEFIAKRLGALRGLTSYARALSALESFPGLERYVGRRPLEEGPQGTQGLAQTALRLLLEEAFAEQTDFNLRQDRLERVLERLEGDALAGAEGTVAVVALRGIVIRSAEVPLADGVVLVRPEACREAPPQLTEEEPEGFILALFHGAGENPRAEAAAAFRDLLRALWLFGDGRVTTSPLAWLRVGGGRWRSFVVGRGGSPAGVLVVPEEAEDELRAFCALVKRRQPQGGPIAWALRRYELGCEREYEEEALTDYLLALRALLEEDGRRGALPGRVAVLCAPPEQREEVRAALQRAERFEEALIAGTAGRSAAGRELVQRTASLLRALLRDLICGHLQPELATLADRLLVEEGAPRLASLPEEDTSELLQRP